MARREDDVVFRARLQTAARIAAAHAREVRVNGVGVAVPEQRHNLKLSRKAASLCRNPQATRRALARGASVGGRIYVPMGAQRQGSNR